MSDQIRHQPLTGPMEYDFGDATPSEWPRGPYITLKDHMLEKIRITRGKFGQICSHCAWETPASGGSYEELMAHIEVCEHHPIRRFIAALVAVCERGDTDHSAKAMYWIASDALKAAGYSSTGKKVEMESTLNPSSEPK